MPQESGRAQAFLPMTNWLVSLLMTCDGAGKEVGSRLRHTVEIRVHHFVAVALVGDTLVTVAGIEREHRHATWRMRGESGDEHLRWIDDVFAGVRAQPCDRGLDIVRVAGRRVALSSGMNTFIEP